MVLRKGSYKMKHFDVIIIGGGSSGFAGAMRAVDLGKTVCIVEKGEVGGAGVAWGALASKCMWELSKDYAGAARIDRGYRAAGLEVKFSEVMNTVHQAVKDKRYQILSQIETFHPDKKQNGSIELYRGEATFIDNTSVKVKLHSGETVSLSADNFLISSGSRPREFAGIPFDHKRIVSSDSILSLKKFPKRILIVGAGIIGCEYATIFSNFGQSEVFLLDHAEGILPFEDNDISDYIDGNLKKNGVKILHTASLRETREFSEHIEALVDFKDGHSKVIEVDVVLVCIGRVPNTDKLNLENVNIILNNRGALIGEDKVKISENIYAAGDVTDSPNLVNVGEMQGRFSIKTMFDVKAREAPIYDGMSTIMFFKPEVASVGLNEKQCKAQNLAYRVSWYSNDLVCRAISMRAKSGFVKILMALDGTNRILGMRAAGPQASSLVMCITMMMDHKMRAEDIIKTIHPHPSMTESIQESIRLLLGKSIYKQEAFPDLIKVTEWNPE
jgi:dihydrolipoamide dehydrogenase